MTAEEIQQIFFVECEESLAAAEAGLAACSAGTQDADTVNGVFRAVHSIKGGAGAFGFTALQAYTHTFETLLSDVRDGSLDISDDLIAMLLRALDQLNDHIEAAREGGQPPEDSVLIGEMTAAMAVNQNGATAQTVAVQPLADAKSEPEAATSDDDFGLDFDLDSLLGGPSAPPAALANWTLRLRPHAGALSNGGEPLLLLRELARLGATVLACDTSLIPPLDLLEPGEGYLGYAWSIPAAVSEDAVREVFDFTGDDCCLAFGEDEPMPLARITPPAMPPEKPTMPMPLTIAGAQAATNAPPSLPANAPAAAAPAGQSIRIDLAKLDQLIDSVGELVIAQAMLAQRLSGEGLAATEELAMLEGLTREIQEAAMSIRAQPISTVFSRVPRILRELAGSTGKHVKLDLVGETTELDKTVIERLGEPMTHLIRNAVDHGIESAEERLAAGKSADGTLTLSAEQRSGRILIRISDDGKGIDRQRVFAKAVEKGLVAADAQLSAEEIDMLIFAPGFSTAQTISNVSGRGVGMDVVRQNVKDLGGRVTIESEPGKGTCFTLTLPLTLAISDGMIVDVGDQRLVVPLTHVVESLRPSDAEIQGLGSGRQMLNVRGRFIPILPVCLALGASDGLTDPSDGVLIVVDTETAGQAALLVDAICDQRQFVIKNLDAHYRSVECVAGATILGDGRVALIVDVESLVGTMLIAPERLAA